MKKYFVPISFLLIFLFAFANAEFFSIQKKEVNDAVCKMTNAYSDKDFNPLNSEIEHCGFFSYTVLPAHHGSQKITTHLSFNTKRITISFTPPTGPSPVQLFGNNYLSYNYPSHNFW
jgi:hypothetical protein